jgi:hypothetical protein
MFSIFSEWGEWFPGSSPKKHLFCQMGRRELCSLGGVWLCCRDCQAVSMSQLLLMLQNDVYHIFLVLC